MQTAGTGPEALDDLPQLRQKKISECALSIGRIPDLSDMFLSVLMAIDSILEEPVKLHCCPTFDVVVHLHTAFAIKPPCPANCPQSVLAVLPAMEGRVFEVTYFCARGHATTGTVRRRPPGNPAARLQLGTAAGALYLPPPPLNGPPCLLPAS